MSDSMNSQTINWAAIRLAFQFQRAQLGLLIETANRARAALPAGRFDAETGEPLDLVGQIEAQYMLLECEHFGDLEVRLDEALAWLDGEDFRRVIPRSVLATSGRAFHPSGE